MEVVARAAHSSAPVIITGESGTGKELVAQTIHKLSPRCAGPYEAINCAAIPETLIESELFGYERGDGGTLLLDEFIEMRPDMQAKLLRVAQRRQSEAARRKAGRSRWMCGCWRPPIDR